VPANVEGRLSIRNSPVSIYTSILHEGQNDVNARREILVKTLCIRYIGKSGMWEVGFHSRIRRTDLPWALKIEDLPHVPEIYRNHTITFRP